MYLLNKKITMKAEKLKRNFWLTTEIECMLNLIKDVQATQGTTATTHYTFVQIANKMRRKGFPNKSPTQIRRKWFQMKSAYLCYKRGNVERLLLIPERFRSVIAQFVEAEYKSGKPPLATTQSTSAPDPIENIETKKKTDVIKNSFYHQKFAKFVARIKHTHKIVNKDFKAMQETLMLYEQKCQAMRDNNLIMFVKNNKFRF